VDNGECFVSTLEEVEWCPTHSDAAVRFGPVQRTLRLNLGPDLWFGSSRLLNFGLDLEGPVRSGRFGSGNP